MSEPSGTGPEPLDLACLGLPPGETKALEVVTDAALKASISAVRAMGWMSPEEVTGLLAPGSDRLRAAEAKLAAIADHCRTAVEGAGPAADSWDVQVSTGAVLGIIRGECEHAGLEAGQ